MASLAADVPKTDRELLLDVHRDVGYIKTKVDKQEIRIRKLESWRWYMLGGITLLTFILVLLGRLIDINIISP